MSRPLSCPAPTRRLSRRTSSPGAPRGSPRSKCRDTCGPSSLSPRRRRSGWRSTACGRWRGSCRRRRNTPTRKDSPSMTDGTAGGGRAQPSSLHSEMSWSMPDRIVVRGFDLPGELMGKVNLGDMAFLELLGRLPSEDESVVFNAMLVALVEHGITPSTLAARLTYLGAPEALQGAVAAGILGLGSVFVGSIEGAARMLQEALPDDKSGVDLQATAVSLVRAYREAKQNIPGAGHPI